MGDSSTSNLPRPSTAGVHVTEHPPGKTNPSPVTLDETDILIEEYLSPRKLKALTGFENLDEVKYLEMRVDTSETSLGNFGSLIPNLSQLKLNNSIIASVRDLGSSFPVLRILWMAQCNLEDLDGVTAMTNLRELYLAFNDVTDLSPLSMMDQLEILDLEGNNISEISQIEFLSLCVNMKNLTLEGNPLCTAPHPDQDVERYDYKSAVVRILPNLEILDDMPTKTSLESDIHPSFDSDWMFLKQLEDEGTIGSLESMDDADSSGPAPIRPTTGYRPGTSIRPTSAMKRLGTARIIGTPSARPKTSQRPVSSDSGTGTDQLTDASELTTGDLVCGNPSKALRSRKKRLTQIHDMGSTHQIFAKYKHHPEHSYPTPETEQVDEPDSLLEELQEWRNHHQTVHKKLEESRAPNILTIEHTENGNDNNSDEGSDGERDGNNLDEEDDDEDLGFVSRQETQPSDEETISPHEESNGKYEPASPKLKPNVTIGARRRRYKPAVDSPLLGVSSSDSDELRPISGPEHPTTNFRATVHKNDPKEVPMPGNSPLVIRADVRSPEKPVIDRSSRTAKAAVFSTMSLKNSKYKIPSLPSRPTVPK